MRFKAIVLIDSIVILPNTAKRHTTQNSTPADVLACYYPLTVCTQYPYTRQHTSPDRREISQGLQPFQRCIQWRKFANLRNFNFQVSYIHIKRLFLPSFCDFSITQLFHFLFHCANCQLCLFTSFAVKSVSKSPKGGYQRKILLSYFFRHYAQKRIIYLSSSFLSVYVLSMYFCFNCSAFCSSPRGLLGVSTTSC